MKLRLLFLTAALVFGFTLVLAMVSQIPGTSAARAQDQPLPLYIKVKRAVVLHGEQNRTSSVVGHAQKDEILKVIKREGDWLLVKTDTDEVGWIPFDTAVPAVSAMTEKQVAIPQKPSAPPASPVFQGPAPKASKTTPAAATPPARPSFPSRVYAKHDVTVYEGPSFNARRLDRFVAGTEFEVLQQQQRFWYRVRTPEKTTGFISTFWVITAREQAKGTAPGSAGQKLSPSNQGQKQGLTPGKIVESTVVQRPAAAAKEAAPGAAAAGLAGGKVYTKHDVTLYKAPAFDAAPLGRFGIGTALEVLSVKDGFWYQVRTPTGVTGFISRFWVSENERSVSRLKAEQKQNAARRQEKIAALLAEVKPIPASNIDDNLRLYRQLLQLDPQNRFYQKKVAFYRRKWERQQQVLRAASRLEVVDWHWYRKGREVLVEGRVKNISNAPLTHAAAVVVWHDHDMQVVATAKSFVELSPLMPYEDAAFLIKAPFSTNMYDATISFIAVSAQLKTYIPSHRYLQLADPSIDP